MNAVFGFQFIIAPNLDKPLLPKYPSFEMNKKHLKLYVHCTIRLVTCYIGYHNGDLHVCYSIR